MATLGIDAFNWTRRLLESYEKSLFTVTSDPTNITVWVPPTEEALKRLDFLAGLYCHLKQVVDAETKPVMRPMPQLAPEVIQAE